MNVEAVAWPPTAHGRRIGRRRCVFAHLDDDALDAEAVIRASVRCTALSRDLAPHQACGCQPLGAWHCALGFRDCLPVLLDGDACLRHFNRFLELQGYLLENQGADDSPPSAPAPPHSLEAVFTTCLAAAPAVHWGAAEVHHCARAQTPSFVGGHAHGWDALLEAMLAALKPADLPITAGGPLNLVLGFEQLADNYRQLEALFEAFEAPVQVLSDARHLLGGARAPRLNPKGTPLAALRAAPGAPDTLIARPRQLGRSRALIAERWGHPLPALPVPMGLAGTDAWVDYLVRRTGRNVPKCLDAQRDALLEAMARARPRLCNRPVALYGEPDFVTGAGRWLLELGCAPAIVCCPNGDRRWQEEMQALLAQAGRKAPVPLLFGRALGQADRRLAEAGAALLIAPPDREPVAARRGDAPGPAAVDLARPGPGGAPPATFGYAGARHLLARILETLDAAGD